MACSSVFITSQNSLLPVTALEFCRVGGSLYLLAGEGPNLKVFSKHGRLLAQTELLSFCKIHGIRPNHTPSSGGSGASGSLRVLVFGQKSIKCLTLQPENNSSLRIECSPATISMDDWILDVCWLCSDEDSSVFGTFRVAVATAHNTVHIIELTTGGDARETALYRCEVNCILYSARLGGSGLDLTVASGTVFNDILLWHVRVTRTQGNSSPTQCAATSGERVKVSLILSGHEGVIFSIRISADGSRLVSVSDDRTVRVWDLPPDWKSMIGSRLSSCSLLLYGHTARVWDSHLLTDCVISVGEDATCRVWDYDGQCVGTVEGHRGRSIWSLAVDEATGAVATGGGDCSIRLFSLHALGKDKMWLMDTTLPVCGPSELNGDASSIENTPRSVELCDSTALCLSNNGSLYVAAVPVVTRVEDGAVPDVVWRLVYRDREFSGYAVMSLSHDRQWLALGSLQGCIALLNLRKNGQSVSCDVKFCGHVGKVFSLTWLGMFHCHGNSLLSCGPSGDMVVWSVKTSQSATSTSKLAPLVHLSLPPSKHRWVTTAILLSTPDRITSTSAVRGDGSPPLHWLVCGDRKGSLHVYQVSLSATDEHECVQPMQSLRGVHGPNGVTHITARGGQVVSCGRDGHCRSFSVQPHRGLTELNKFKPVRGMDWIERQLFSDTGHLVLGFQATDMVLYNVTENRRLMSINCGGGHRSYGLTDLHELIRSKEAVVVYIKKSVISLRIADLTEQLTTPVIQEGFVGREAVSLQVVQSDPVTGSGVVAVGSEDCSVCLLSLCPSPDSSSLAVRTERFIHGHISSVRALSTSPSLPGHQSPTLLFSGGARACLKVWKINNGGVDGGGLEVTLEAELSIHDDAVSRKKTKKRRRPKGPGAESLLPECRIMALTSLPLTQVVDEDSGRQHYVAAGCSDGPIRHYIYSEETRSFNSLGDLLFHNRCILTLGHLILPSSQCVDTAALCVLSAATDGRVAVWHVNSALLLPNNTASCTSTGASGGGVDDGCTTRQTKGAQNGSTTPLAVCQAHQSGINDIATQQVREGLYLVATVGDDNALTILKLSLSASSLQAVGLEVLCKEASAHASSITGVSFLHQSVVVTTSIDQRLTAWRIRLPAVEPSGRDRDEASERDTVQCDQQPQGVGVGQVWSHTHDVADASSLTLYHWREDRAAVVICGVGLQCFNIQQHFC